MSIECAECERDLRGGHDSSCSRALKPYTEAELSDVLNDEEAAPDVWRLVATLTAERTARETAERERDEARAERDKARADVRFMVDVAAAQKLDGYRELGARAAAAENDRDSLRARLAAAEARELELARLLESAVLDLGGECIVDAVGTIGYRARMNKAFVETVQRALAAYDRSGGGK